ncbi:hypothetical protein LCGC14_1506400 [marine sediment metagenome]|uniref:Uncharacterized protein n=1 Tax=marine sediment metagenome TaxID=412755 RepID=A0A0F9J2M0_9ZZZZ
MVCDWAVKRTMDECRECDGAVIECISYNDNNGKQINQCPRCGDRTDEWGKKIKC